MNNEIIISNVNPQDINIGEGGATGITGVLVNGVDVVENNIAYVVVPTKLSELQNDTHFISQETDPTVPYFVKQITLSDINRWNSKQDQLLSGVNIKTINNNSILGEGNINVDKTYTAGTGINITSENVINNTITSYNDLNDLPTIPTKISDLQNDSDFVESSELSNVAFSGSYLDLSNTPDLNDYATLDTNELLNYYTKDFFFNILPKVSGSGTNITLNDTIENVQMYLSLGASELSQSGTPTPSSPQDIHTISGSNKVVVNGKNLLDTSYLVEANADKTYNGYGYWAFKLTDELDTFTFSRANGDIVSTANYLTIGTGSDLATAYSNMLWIMHPSISGLNKQSRTITNTGELWLFIGNSMEKIVNTIIGAGYLQLEKGSVATNYVPYVSQEQEVDLGDIEYCKIGTYADRIFKNVSGDTDYSSEREDGAWYIKKNIGKVVLDGSEDEGWALGSVFYTNANYLELPAVSASKIYSNYFTDNLSGATDNYIAIPGDSSNKRIWLKATQFETANDLTTWLSTHNTDLYYILATPTYTQITGTLAEQLENVYQKMLSYEGTTNISQVNNDLPFIISATTLKNMSNL